MNIEITYIHHNCFVLKTPGRTFLFDYPEDEHLPAGAAERVRKQVAGTRLAVFISHGHGDHLNRDISSVANCAESVCYVFSDDVEDLRPEALPDHECLLVVEPDETYEFDGMTVTTLMSNDLGVAFLVEDGPFRLYFGGDLAKWIWPGASLQEARFTESFFNAAIERVRTFSPHVAFSNVDKRLPNLGGGDELCRMVEPDLFVPMHTFGDTEGLQSVFGLADEGTGRLFLYAESGESAIFTVGDA